MSLLASHSSLPPPQYLRAGGGGGGPLVQWVFSDPLGSGVLLTNSNATSVLRRHFEPFGRLVHETTTSGTWPRPQFAGHLDDGIGLYDFRARHYDPDAAQFVQIDPLVPDPYQPADLNPYGYVRNDPLNATDPTGEWGELLVALDSPRFGGHMRLLRAKTSGWFEPIRYGVVRSGGGKA